MVNFIVQIAWKGYRINEDQREIDLSLPIRSLKQTSIREFGHLDFSGRIGIFTSQKYTNRLKLDRCLKLDTREKKQNYPLGGIE